MSAQLWVWTSFLPAMTMMVVTSANLSSRCTLINEEIVHGCFFFGQSLSSIGEWKPLRHRRRQTTATVVKPFRIDFSTVATTTQPIEQLQSVAIFGNVDWRRRRRKSNVDGQRELERWKSMCAMWNNRRVSLAHITAHWWRPNKEKRYHLNYIVSTRGKSLFFAVPVSVK